MAVATRNLVLVSGRQSESTHIGSYVRFALWVAPWVAVLWVIGGMHSQFQRQVDAVLRPVRSVYVTNVTPGSGYEMPANMGLSPKLDVRVLRGEQIRFDDVDIPTFPNAQGMVAIILPSNGYTSYYAHVLDSIRSVGTQQIYRLKGDARILTEDKFVRQLAFTHWPCTYPCERVGVVVVRDHRVVKSMTIQVAPLPAE